MGKKELEFSFNWNRKLDCKVFTTLRLSDRYELGDEIDIYLKNRRLGKAKVISKHKFKIGEITELVAGIDTGYSKKECIQIIKRMYGKAVSNDSMIILYGLMYITEAMEKNQGELELK